MGQLIFSKDFNDIIEEKKYWKKMEDFPISIRNFVLDTSHSFLLNDLETGAKLCSNCYKKLENGICPSCHKNYQPFIQENSNYIINLFDKEYQCYYYVFDVVDYGILLYKIQEFTSYYNPLSLLPYRTSKFTVANVYQVLSDRIIDLMTNKEYSFDRIERLESQDFQNSSEEDANLFSTFFNLEDSFLYVANLDQLSQTDLYRYTSIEKVKDYIITNKFMLATLTYFPLHFPQFEYLVKMKLYDLACMCTSEFKKGHNFKECFGIDKKYYPLMKEMNITWDELLVLKKYPTLDSSILRFFSRDSWLITDLLKYVSLEQLKNYLDQQKLTSIFIADYHDYLDCCVKLGLNLKDKDILFPPHFIEQHNLLLMEKYIAEDPEMNQKIYNLSKILSFNIYEDQDYIIFPADSIYSLIDESSQMSNCVRTYGEKIATNQCQIYFMRYKNQKDKSLVTVEVRNGKVVQAKTRFNRDIDEKMRMFLQKWERQLLPIIVKEENDF